MNRYRFYSKGFWVDKHLDPWVTTIMIMVHFGLAMSIIIGGVERFSLPSYQPLISLSQGYVWMWGILIGLSAFLMAMPFRIMNIVGLWLGMSWHLAWAAAFIVASVHDPTSASTPIPVYLGLAMICSALLTARIIDKSKD
jgi:hypothetical protein